MLRVLLFVFALVAALLQAQSASAAACKIGERVTLTVSLGSLADTGVGWFYEGGSARPCTVNVLLGKGTPPASCKDGSVLTASGTVEHLHGPTLIVESVSCK